jgi:hypothetical protein
MLRALLCSLGTTIAIGACATSSPPRPPEVHGPVTAGDVREITSVVMQRSDIRKPILRIDSDRENRADITAGQDRAAGDRANTFKMAKQRGQWKIVSPIGEEQIIITSGGY